MDKTLIMTKHFEIYLSTLQVGVGILFVPEHKSLHLHFLILEFVLVG